MEYKCKYWHFISWHTTTSWQQSAWLISLQDTQFHHQQAYPKLVLIISKQCLHWQWCIKPIARVYYRLSITFWMLSCLYELHQTVTFNSESPQPWWEGKDTIFPPPVGRDCHVAPNITAGSYEVATPSWKGHLVSGLLSLLHDHGSISFYVASEERLPCGSRYKSR